MNPNYFQEPLYPKLYIIPQKSVFQKVNHEHMHIPYKIFQIFDNKYFAIKYDKQPINNNDN